MPLGSDEETGLATKVPIEESTSGQEPQKDSDFSKSSNLLKKVVLLASILLLLAGASILFIRAQGTKASPPYSPLTKTTSDNGVGDSASSDVGVYSSGAESSVCDEIAGTPSTMPISPVLTNYCKRRRSGGCHILLDPSTCSNTNCRFGYETNAKGCPISCNCLTHGVIEGTVEMDTNNVALLYPYQPLKELNYYDLVQSDGKVANIFQRWTSNEIPFMFEANKFNETVKNEIKSYLSTFSLRSCVKFVETSDMFVKHVFIKKGAICSSPVGGISTDIRTEMTLSDACVNLQGILHMFMQVLGFHHTQNSPKRDQYISISKGNIEKEYLPYFNKLEFELDLDIDYNLHSIMHFPLRAFSSDEKLSTMKVLSAEAVKHAHQTGLQDTDIAGINIRYQCPEYRELIENLGSSWAPWGEWKPHSTIDACARIRLCVRKTTNRISVGCPNPNNPNWVFDYQQSVDCQGKNITARGRHHGGDHQEDEKPSMFASVDSMSLFCPGGNIYPARFNGDSTSDLFCHFTNGFGRIYIAEGASYPRVLWEGQTQICRNREGDKDNGKLVVLDINGDTFSDIACIYPSGRIDVSFYDDGMFHDAVSFSQMYEQCSQHQGNSAAIVDADGDGKGDLLCGRNRGFQHIFYNVFTEDLMPFNTTVNYSLN